MTTATDTLVAVLGGALLLPAAFYLGTGLSIILFQYRTTGTASGAKNFVDSFVSPVNMAIRTFTVLTTLMLIGSSVLAIAEWGSLRMILPVAYFLTVAGAATYTVRIMFPINHKLAAMPGDAEFHRLIALWKKRHNLRAVLWSSEIVYMAAWLVLLARRGR
jgi:hypothetical protein